MTLPRTRTKIDIDRYTHELAIEFYRRRGKMLARVVRDLLIDDMDRIERAERAAATRRSWDRWPA